MNIPYEKVGRASELSGKDRVLYRFLEMVPGLLAWGTIIGAIVASRWIPYYASLFIIAFDIYWFIKTSFLSIHLRHNWKRTIKTMSTDWVAMLSHTKYEHIWHMVVLPFYKEDESVIEKTIQAVLSAKVDPRKVIVVLAAEARAGSEHIQVADKMRYTYGSRFGHFIVTIHPDGIPGEMAGKGSNISYASEQARLKVLDPYRIPYADVIVSAFDIDTIVYPSYFACLTWHVLTHPRPLHASFQPVPFYNNNIWQAPALSRVVAFSGTFWQMIQQERPERLATFSSHALIFDTLYKVAYWQKNMVSEDSRIFWNCFIAFKGDYEVVPISYPVSMDANLAPTFWQTLKNIYKQQRRWSWGSENVPYILFNFIKNKDIPWKTKARMSFIQLEGFWSLSTNPILIFLLGWLPVLIGVGSYRVSILAYNLPNITRDIMFITMFGLFVSAYIAFTLLPKQTIDSSRLTKTWMLLQWILVPVTITIFGAIPALDAQTRLLIGKYMGFWVTPKHR
jgi:hypothetical protein